MSGEMLGLIRIWGHKEDALFAPGGGQFSEVGFKAPNHRRFAQRRLSTPPAWTPGLA